MFPYYKGRGLRLSCENAEDLDNMLVLIKSFRENYKSVLKIE